ncbi:hypothetical protein FB451DRAFT_1563383 [Mycena latifolia]|nr:hypothetical protein FB451DRAFT_1563383 [Mycena latifolia]
MKSQPELPFSTLLPSTTQVSQLREVLRSSCIPLETSHFRSAIASSAAELARYDAEIERLEAAKLQEALAQTVSERAFFQGYALGCRSLFSPIRRLPAEVLVEIFLYFVPPFPAFPTKETALDLLRNVDVLHSAQVCYYWRIVAMGTTALWSSIVVHDKVDCSAEQIQSLISLALQRSGKSPLAIELVGAADGSTPIARCALELLGQHSRRWRDVRLLLPPPFVQILRGVKSNLPLLEHIHLYGSAGRELDLFEVAPQLRTLTCGMSAREIPSALPWGQLTTFEYFYGIPEDLPNLWAALTRLSIGTEALLDFEFEASVPLALVPITTNLDSVEMHFTCPDPGLSRQVLSEIMKHVTFPHLFELCLFSGFGAPPPDWPHQEFLSLASRSSFPTNLTILQLNMIKIPEVELLEVLSVLRVLEKLTIFDDDSGSGAGPALISNDLLRHLVYTPETTCLIPALEFLVSAMKFATPRNNRDARQTRRVTSKSRPTRASDLAVDSLNGTSRVYTSYRVFASGFPYLSLPPATIIVPTQTEICALAAREQVPPESPMHLRCWKCGAPPEPLSPTPAARVVVAASSEAFTHLLTSNDIPLDQEVPGIRHFLGNVQDGLDALDAQIDTLHATLTQLVRQREEMAEDLRRHRAVLSPIRRVPPELICAIFSMTLPFTRRAPTGTKHANGGSVQQAPWHLGHICRFWRAVALSYPLLWSSIHVVDPPHPSQFANIYPRSMMESQLLRSGSQPLDVVLECNGDLGLQDSVALTSDRWRALVVKASGLNSVLSLFSVTQGRLSGLEMLELIDPRGYWSSAPSDFFSTAPNLRKVILTDSRLRQPSPTLVLPWYQITHYRGTYRAERQLEILQAAPGLVQCSLSFSNTVQPAGHELVVLPALRRLYIRQASFLDLLDAPFLEDLFVEDFSIGTILPFVERSSCQLTKLVLLGCTIPAVSLALPSLSTLTDLHIRADTVERTPPSHLFDALTVASSKPIVCPRLVSFSFGIGGRISPLAGCADSLLAMVQSRLVPISQSRLYVVRLYCDGPPDDLARAVGMLAREGLDVAFLGEREAEDLFEQQRF